MPEAGAEPRPPYADRLAVFMDVPFSVAPDGALSTPISFPTYAWDVARQFRFATFVARGQDADQPASFVLPAGARLVRLPFYRSLREPAAVLRVLGRTVPALWRALDGIDTVWVLGPNPFGVVLVAIARLRGRRVVLGTRENTLEYVRHRLRPGLKGRVGLAPGWLLAAAWHGLARRRPVVVVGDDLARVYREAGARRVHVMRVLLARSDQIAAEPIERDYGGEIRLLNVGRIEPEKNPMLLVEAFAELERRRPGRYRLTWVGTGRMHDEVAERVGALGLADRVDMRGYVAFGEPLLDLYRASHVLVHVSLTEGLPQVLLEAMATSTPIVATDVGGVAAALAGGSRGALVPARDHRALVAAVERVVDDADERRARVEAGLAFARSVARELETARIADFIAGERS